MLTVIGIVAVLAVAVGVDRLLFNAGRPAPSSPATGSAPMSPVAGTTPRNDPTAPPTSGPEPTLEAIRVARCLEADLAMAAGGWGGATGSMAGGATLINTEIDACRIAGKPALKLLANDHAVIARGSPAASGELVVLPPGGVAGVIVVWRNWCGDPPERPLTLRLSLLDGAGSLDAVVDDWDVTGGGGETGTSLPRCDSATAPSTIDAPLPFAAPGPSEDGVELERCTSDGLRAYLGGWGAAAGTSYASVAVFNRAGVDCSLATSPPLELRDANGALLVTGEPWVDGDSTVDLPAGRAAITMIGFANWCEAAPKLPMRFDLRIGADRLPVVPTSARSQFGLPTCNSAPMTPPPYLGYTGPFTLPGS